MGKLASWLTFLCQLIMDKFPVEYVCAQPSGRKRQKSVMISHLIQIKSGGTGRSIVFFCSVSSIMFSNKP